MKKAFKLMAIALVAGAMFTACGGEEGTGSGNDWPVEAVLLEEGFEAGSLPAGWTNIDVDADGEAWCFDAGNFGGANGSSGIAYSKSFYNNFGPLTPDNYLVTPALKIADGNYMVSWQVCGQDARYAHEYYEVHVGTVTDGAFTSAGKIFSGYADGAKSQSAWLSKSASLADYANQELCIAFRHCNTTDEFYLNLDNVKVYHN